MLKKITLKKTLLTLVLPASIVINTTAMAELTKADLAREVAHCYVGH